MPVILGSRDYLRWLDTNVREFVEIEELLRPYASVTAQPVDKRVGNTNRNDAELMTVTS
jgi:putative SOS response-associated peptidase YedK